MSSSHQSSRPSPKWRSSLSNPKRQRPATSVSLIFAQPEQGSKLGSAIDRLPATVGIDDAASFMSQGSRKRERTQSQASSVVIRVEEERTEDHPKPQQDEDGARKRSKLGLNVETDAPSTNPAVNGLDDESYSGAGQGSAANPVDLTESPKAASPPQNTPVTAIEAKDATKPPSSPQESAVPFPSTNPQKTVRMSKSSPARSSWFGFSRAKGESSDSTTRAGDKRDAERPSSIRERAGASSAQSAPPGASKGDTDSEAPAPAESPSIPTPPQTIPSQPNASPALSYTPAQYSPPNHRINSNATSISSVDEEVPRPRFTSLDNRATLIPPPAIVESQVMKTADRKPSISSLNPSTSRFTLKLPLLGRPKVPLEQAVAVAQAEDIRDTSKAAEDVVQEGDPAGATSAESTMGPASASGPEDAAQPTAEQNVPEETPTSQLEPARPAQNTATVEPAKEEGANSHVARTASWWDYLGWGGHHPEEHTHTSDHKHASDVANPQNTAHGDPQQPASAVDAHDSVSEEPPAVPKSPTVPESLTEPSVDIKPDSGTDGKDVSSPTQPTAAQVSQDDHAPAKATSIFSAETARSHGSAWYSPWAWYTTSPTTSSNARGDSAVTKSKDNSKTESEMVKEEALAREQHEQAGPPESAQAPTSSADAPTGNSTPKTPQGESTAKNSEGETTPKALATTSESPNPVQTSLADNKSGWMSFFMSKALTVKSVTNESNDKKGDEMEVMEIDDEPQPSAAIAIPTGKDVQGAATTTSAKASSPASSSPVVPSTPKSPTGKSPASPPPKEREPRKPDPPAEPLTDSESIKRDTAKGAQRAPSPTPSKASGTTPPNSARPAPPNFVLPTWEDTFHSPPRSYTPPRSQSAKSKLTGALSYVTGALFSKDERGHAKGNSKGKEREQQSISPEFLTFGQELPKAFDVLGEQLNPYMLSGGCRVVVIGVAGWSPGAVTRTLAGGLPSSSSKFVNMTAQALEQFAAEHGFKFKKITRMPLEGDGTIRKKVSRVYNHLVNNEEWMEDLHAADVIFVASHSQGAIISTHLIDRLIEDGHILTSRSVDTLAKSAAALAAGGAAAVPTTQAQKVCLLALCGIHLGPLRYLKTSSLLQPYIQYVENPAARELFEFQDTESKLSKNYIGALRNVMDHGAKVVYIASLNDQVVPIYSGLFTAASHPRILRALYIDNDAYHSSDFLSNLLILLIRILNAGLSDRGLLAHLSEATAGTLSGVGHSTAYEEPATYSLAVKYFFMTNDGTNADAELVINPFNAVEEQNDYEIPWLLRDLIADTKVAHFFAREFSQLRDAFDDWQPKTTILREVKKKLQPITRLSSIQLQLPATSTSMSKL